MIYLIHKKTLVVYKVFAWNRKDVFSLVSGFVCSCLLNWNFLDE